MCTHHRSPCFPQNHPKKNHSFPLQANEFFCGLSIPDPGTIEPLENKLPKDLGSDGVDFTLRSDFFSYSEG